MYFSNKSLKGKDKRSRGADSRSSLRDTWLRITLVLGLSIGLFSALLSLRNLRAQSDDSYSFSVGLPPTNASSGSLQLPPPPIYDEDTKEFPLPDRSLELLKLEDETTKRIILPDLQAGTISLPKDFARIPNN